jgi:hypothetical protein
LSYKVLQLSPQASTDVICTRTAIQDPWSGSVASSREIGFLPSWIEDEAELDEASEPNRAISGLALAVAFSASFWAGLAWIVARAWG